jgi:hypothetical protein
VTAVAEETKSPPEGEKAEAEKQECRCEEARGKTFSGMLRLVLEDLAFWRKRKK